MRWLLRTVTGFSRKVYVGYISHNATIRRLESAFCSALCEFYFKTTDGDAALILQNSLPYEYTLIMPCLCYFDNLISVFLLIILIFNERDLHIYFLIFIFCQRTNFFLVCIRDSRKSKACIYLRHLNINSGCYYIFKNVSLFIPDA